MFWLVDMRLHFHFAASDLFLGLGHSGYICTGQAKWHAQDQRNADKVELECFVKACFIFIVFCLVLFICLGSNVHIYTKDQSQ